METLVNIFNGLATLVTGLVAWVVYLRSKRDKKIEAVNIILNEIYVAEREISKIKENKIINNYTFILPSNHWGEFQHLFVKNFDSDEMRRISDFFKSCSLAEETVNILRSYLPKAQDQKSKIIQSKLLDLIEKTKNEEEYKKEKERISKIFHEESYYFVPFEPNQKLFDYLQNINFISLTSVDTNLRKIRDSRWYCLIV